MKFHLFHRWSKWESKEMFAVVTVYTLTKKELPVLVQRRTCEICGLVQQRSSELMR